MVPHVNWQASLLDAGGDPAFDASFAHLTRIQLDERSWVDHAPGWVSSSDRLFSDLVAEAAWNRRSRHMYGRQVAEPRLTSWWNAASGRPLEPPILEEMRRHLSAHYGTEFDSMGLNLYRDGRDSVAWHGDRIAGEIAEPLVAIVSIGEPRKFLLRPVSRSAGGAASRAFLLGRGDLLVTGGRCQREWLHSVPKVLAAGARISITFRHGLDVRAYPDEQ
jgi:alkylated DNA repair dioxygenase AlkB